MSHRERVAFEAAPLMKRAPRTSGRANRRSRCSVDKHETKAILACYRPGRDDPRAPEFAEALERARQDPQLARWLQGQMERDAALHRQFTEIGASGHAERLQSELAIPTS